MLQELIPNRFTEIVNMSDKDDFEIYEIDAKELFSSQRFDFYAKYLFIDYYVKGFDLSYAEEVYKRHIQAITGYTYSERGQQDKNSYKDFIKVFKNLINDIRDNGFNKEKSLIVLSKDGIPMDGAHRIVVAAYFNKKVSVIKLKNIETGSVPNFEFFRNNLLGEQHLDSMALEYCNLHGDNLYMGCLWPAAGNSNLRQKAEDLIREGCNVVYKKEVELSYNGMKNLMIQAYLGFEWMGTDFNGVYGKLDACYSPNESCVFYLFEGSNLDFVLELKQKIRNIFSIENHSIHITDNYRETKQIANLIFNQNSLNHLNKSNPGKFKKSYSLMEDFKKIILEQDLNIDEFVIDTSLSMAIYGIREASDLDYYTTAIIPSQVIDEKAKIKGSINNHQDEIQHHLLDVNEMINIPSNHFFYNEMKFLSLDNIKIMKRRRNERKDVIDIKLINSFINENKFNYILLGLKNSFLRKKRRLSIFIKKNFINLLKFIGFFNTIYKIYKNLKKLLK